MGNQFAGEAEEANRVREFRVGIESRVVGPLGVNDERKRIAHRLIEMDVNTARLGSRWFNHERQLVHKSLLLPRLRLKSNENVKWHDGPPGRS